MNIAKFINKKLKDKNFINNLLMNCESNEAIYMQLGYFLSYTIATRSKETPEHMLMGYNCNNQYIYNENVTKKLSMQNLNDNIFKKGFLTHSFNGYFYDRVKKYGLGSDKLLDKELQTDFEYAEKFLGQSRFHNFQTNSINETYLTSPGVKTFYYGCEYSPERLWLGLLYQDRNNAEPVIIGETKEEYAKRVISKKIERMDDSISEEDKEELTKCCNRIIHKLCSHNPVVAMIPIHKIKNILISHASAQNGSTTLSEKFEEERFAKNNPVYYFSQNTDGAETNNFGNITTLEQIPSKFLQFFEVEDTFTLMQRKAILQGRKVGDKIDFFTGQNYVEKNKQSPTLEHNTNSIEKENIQEPVIENTDLQNIKQNIQNIKQQQQNLKEQQNKQYEYNNDKAEINLENTTSIQRTTHFR